MKIRLVFGLILLSAALGLNAEETPPSHHLPGAGGQVEQPTPESILAAQVQEIAASPSLSRRAKERRIASAVRQAVIAATANVAEPGQALRIALALAKAAAQAAPYFANSIRDAIISIPSIASIAGAVTQIQATVTAAAVAATGGNPPGGSSSTPPTPPQNPESNGGSGDVVVSPAH
jgi:hypothetical protein